MAKVPDPAPVPSDRPSIKQLAEVIRMEDIDISTQWRDLGLELVDSNKILRVIEANNRNDVNTCCRVMFEKWLEMTPDASWNQLIIALIAIKMNTAANAISKLLKSENIKGEEDHVVSGEGDYNFAAPVECTTNLSSTSFSDYDNIRKAFLRLTAEVSRLLKKADFCTLRRAIVEQRKVPSGVQFPADLHESIKKAQDLDKLLDVLADSDYWSWIDLRLLEALIISSGIKEAEILINAYKEVIFSKKLSDIIHELFVPQQKKKRCEEAYIAKVGTKISKKPDEVTVRDLSDYRGILEKVIMDIHNGSCVLKHLRSGCLEIHWTIPIHCRLHAYKSALNNRHKFCDIHLQYLHIEPYQPIFNPFTIPPTMMATLLHLSKPIASTPAEVIDHYYYFLADKVDNNLMQQTMHELKVVCEKDIIDSTTMCNEYQKNAFLLDHLLVASTDSILAFCHSLQAKNEQLGHMLMNAIKSIPTDSTDARQSSSTPYQLTCSEEYDQPQVFLAAKSVHLRFLNLITKLSQKLKNYDSKTFLAACDKLTENDSHLKAIPLLASSYVDDLDNSGTDEIFMRFSFMWTWINHSFLRALLEACGCQDGIIMLDEFESQIDTNQPIELYPIPPPSMKMAPSLSSAYTILSIRSEQYTDDSPPLQYVNEVALIMTEKFGVSSYTFQLLAARNNPVMLYWIILWKIVPIINDGVKKYLNFLKQRKFSEFAIYPNTILYTTDNLNHGSFAMLSSQPQVLKTENPLRVGDRIMSINYQQTYDMSPYEIEIAQKQPNLRLVIERDFALPSMVSVNNSAKPAKRRTEMLYDKDTEEYDYSVLVLGVTGVGKSTMCNFFFNAREDENIFGYVEGIVPGTSQCYASCNFINGQNILFIDSPGFSDARSDNHEQMQEMGKALLLARNGVNAIVVCLNGAGRFTDAYKSFLTELQQLEANGFQSVWAYTFLVFTHGQSMGRNEQERYAKIYKWKADPKCHPLFLKLLDKVQNRFMVLESLNDDTEYYGKKCEEFVKLIEHVSTENNQKCYTHKLFVWARDKYEEAAKKQQQQRIDKETEQQENFIKSYLEMLKEKEKHILQFENEKKELAKKQKETEDELYRD